MHDDELEQKAKIQPISSLADHPMHSMEEEEEDNENAVDDEDDDDAEEEDEDEDEDLDGMRTRRQSDVDME